MQDEHLKAALGYKKFTGTPRVLFIDTGYLVIGDVIEAAEDLGWEVMRLSMKGKGKGEGSTIGALLKALVLHRPDFVLTMNHLGFDESGQLAKLLAHFGVFIASWFVDHPFPILGGASENAVDNLQVFCFERTALDWLSAQGYADPVHLPTGANRRYFHPDKVDIQRRDSLACSLSFAGNSWWTKARVEPSKTVVDAARKLPPKKPVDKTVLLGDFEQRLVKQIPKKGRLRFAATRVMLAEASMQKRADFAKALLPLGIRVFGDPHWDKMAPGLDRVSFVDNHTGLPALFMGSNINANVTAVQMPTAVNQRVWDVPAVGGFLLTDDQTEILDHFVPDKEVVLYRDFEEAADKARFYLKNETARARIGRNGLARVDRDHDMKQRLSTVWHVMAKRFG